MIYQKSPNSETTPKTAKRLVLLRIPQDLLQDIDRIRGILNLSRTSMILKSIGRNLLYVKANELPLVERNERLREAFSPTLPTGGVK